MQQQSRQRQLAFGVAPAHFDHLRFRPNLKRHPCRSTGVESGLLNAVHINAQQSGEARLTATGAVFARLLKLQVVLFSQRRWLEAVAARTVVVREKELRHGQPLTRRSKSEADHQPSETERVQGCM